MEYGLITTVFDKLTDYSKDSGMQIWIFDSS